MDRSTNIVDFTPSMSSGKDVRDTQQISGEAKKSSTWSAKNETKEYTTAAIKPGKLGGLQSN